MTRLAAILLLAAAHLRGQSTGSIAGTVIDSVTGVPIRRAQVHLNGSLAVTDASGSFLFDRAPAGPYSVRAQHPDYPPNLRTGNSQVMVTLAPGEQKRGIEFKLTPAAAISGHISDDDGDPLANCNLSLLTRNGKFLMMTVNAVSNQNGEYLVQTVPAGKYYVEAQCNAPHLQPRPFAPPDAVLPGHALGFGYRFYPGIPDFNGAQRLTVTPGQIFRGVDFRMALETVSSLLVHVNGLTGEVSRRAMASLTPDDGSPTIPNNTRSAPIQPRTGSARIVSVPPGKYTLRVTTFGPEQLVVSKQPVQIGEESSEVTVQAISPVQLTGIVYVDQPGDAPPQTSTVLLTREEGSNVQLQAQVKPDNTFAFRPLSPGHYRVALNGGLFVQSVRLSGESYEGAEFELKPGGAGTLEIHVSNQMGTLSGDVATGSAHSAQIRIVTTVPSTQSGVADIPGDAPHFSVRMAPGHYRLYAVEIVAGKDPFEFLGDAALAARGEQIDIRAGSEVVKNLKLITAEEIEKADP